MKGLPGIGAEGALMHVQDQVLVLFVHPVVGNDRANELADPPLRIGIGIADAKRGRGVIPGEVQGHGVQVSHAIWQHCTVRLASV